MAERGRVESEVVGWFGKNSSRKDGYVFPMLSGAAVHGIVNVPDRFSAAYMKHKRASALMMNGLSHATVLNVHCNASIFVFHNSVLKRSCYHREICRYHSVSKSLKLDLA